ncbi:hypothetical protein N2152v2_006543 [Parachlorella kessleri]
MQTYAEAEIVPGPRLNLVLGPNGTGKSSLVCAICVGLAGGTRLLGRAEEVSSFVRRGTKEGWVEIMLCSGDPGRPYVIRRSLHADHNSSQWRLNGRDCSMADVKEVVGKLHVQLDNLCQFLPQDKVVEFARMKPVQLLHATEQAIENGELYEQHQQLVEERAQLRDHEAAASAVENSLNRLRAENARNEATVAQVRKRKKLLAEVEEMKKKVPWLEYQAAKDEWDAEKQRFGVVKEQLAEKQRGLRQQEGPLKEARKLIARLEKKRKDAADVVRPLDEKIAGKNGAKGLEEQLQDTLDAIEDKDKEVDGLAEQSRQRAEKMAKLEADIQRFQQELDSLPADTTPQIAEERSRLAQEQNDVNVQLSALKEQVDEVKEEQQEQAQQRQRAQQRLQRLEDAKLQRLQALEDRHRGITQAWQWLQQGQTRKMFRGRVYGPIAAEVECPNARHAGFLEQHVAQAIWSFFVTEHQEDQDLLSHEIKNRFKFTPNVANYTGNADTPLQYPKGEASQLARYGITHTLDQVFVAPSLVKHVLCDESRLSEAFVGTEQTQEMMERLLADNRQIESMWVPESNYRRNISRYNPAAESVMVTETRPARLLARGQSQGSQEREQAQAAIVRHDRNLRQLDGQLAELEKQLRDVQQKANGIGNQLAQLNKRVADNVTRRRQLGVKVKSARKDLDRTRQQPDPLARQPQLQRQQGELRKKAFVLALELSQRWGFIPHNILHCCTLFQALELAQAMTLLGVGLPKLQALDLALREAKEHEEAYTRANRAAEQELARLQAAIQRYAANVDNLKALARRKKTEAEEASTCLLVTSDVPLYPPSRRKKEEAEEVAPLTAALQAKFGEMPDDLPELRREMDQKASVAEAEGICISNPAALEEYNRRCEEIHRQEGELAQLTQNLELSKAKIEQVKGAWLPRLRQVVEQVNEAFSHSFAQVGCAGEVALRETEGEDFANYAIEIRVKFRDAEELQTLDANRQSGGERSVSTMLYLISLQGVTVTPFRVVDEINQGMDPVNERKIFKQLVRAACRQVGRLRLCAGTPQCFLLTPKLLPDLPFTRDVKVLQIMNGPHIRDVAANFSMTKLLGSQRMSQLSQRSQPGENGFENGSA